MALGNEENSIAPISETDPDYERRWWILAVLGIAQLMVILDASVVNIALPSAQRALHFSNDNRQWVISGYALAFGSLLLVGGRIGDLFGRKRTFVTGAVGFAIASIVGGSAHSFLVLVSARVVQGIFAALLAPAALSILSTTFTDAKERGRAFGIWGTIAGAGGAVGLLIGGLLTQELSWRWTMYINAPLAVLAAIGAMALLHSHVHTVRPRIDWPGTVTASSGLFALVFGFSRAETHGWSSSATLAFIAAGVILLSAFVFIQRRSTHPLLHLRVVLDRNRGGAFLSLAVVGSAIFAVFLFLVYYLQQILGYSPIKCGLATMPMAFGLIAAAGITTSLLLPRVGPRPLVVPGMLISAVGMALLTRLGVHSSYVGGVLPGLVITGFGLGTVLAPTLNIATAGIEEGDSGVASALANTMQQVGGSLGIALLGTLGASAATSYLMGKEATPHNLAEASVKSYTTGFAWGAGILAAGAVATFFLMRGEAPHLQPGFEAEEIFIPLL
jgi:EmrB/QacA subfamily drug resistance transporter